MAATASNPRPATRGASVPTPQAAPADLFPYYYATHLGAQVRANLRNAAEADLPILRDAFYAAAAVLLDALGRGGWGLSESEEGDWFVTDVNDGESFRIMYI